MNPPLPSEVEIASADPANQFGKYVRVALLGEGGMGEVWKAWDRELGRWVALKFPRFDGREDLERLRKEAQAAGRLNHPNLAAVYEFAQAQGKHFIAMEFVDGEPLSRWPRTDRKALVGYVREAAHGVASAHATGVVHRDLKPDNVMVARGGGHVYVMDFGIARQATATLTSTSAGTPPYMSPEQIRGARVDGRSDVWSLGATLYELLADRLPFEGATAGDIARRILDEDPAPLRGVEADLGTIVLKCLEKDPERRYATAQDLADDLGLWASGEPIRASKPSLGYRVKRSLRKRKLAALAAVLVLVLALVSSEVISSRKESRRETRAMLNEAEGAQHESRLLQASQAVKNALAREPSNAEAKDRLQAIEARMTKARGLLFGATEQLKNIEVSLRKEEYTDTAPGDVKLARAKIDQALAEWADFPDALFAMASSHLLLLDAERAKAVDFCTRTLKADRTFAQAYLLRAIVNAEDYENTHHVVESQAAREETPKDKELWSAIQSDLAAYERLTTDTTLRDYAQGILKFARQDYLNAVELLRQRTTKSKHLECRLLGHAYKHALKYREAIEWLTAALELRPGDLAAREWRMACAAELFTDLQNRSEATEAKQVYEALMTDCKKLPNLPMAMFIRAGTSLQMDEYDRAIEAADEILQRWRGLPFALNVRGLARMKKKDFARAEADLAAAVAAVPQDATYRASLGELYLASSRPVQAAESFSKAASIAPPSCHRWGVYTNWMRALIDQGDLAGAADVQSKVLEVAADDEYAPLHRWYLGRQAGRSETEAREALVQAKGRFKEGEWPHPVLRLFQGEITPQACLDASRDPNAAKAAARRCQGLYYIGQWRLVNGDKAAAMMDFQACVETGLERIPEQPLAASMLRRLRP